jgi:deazaflavin-dependent oxidoreductase (nitroreductase family)
MRPIDRIMRAAVRLGFARHSTALLETTGRKSGLPRVTPLTNGLDGNVFWIVTEHGHNAAYVRNIEAEPRVRVRVRNGWRAGSAQIVNDEPPREASCERERRDHPGSSPKSGPPSPDLAQPAKRECRSRNSAPATPTLWTNRRSSPPVWAPEAGRD